MKDTAPVKRAARPPGSLGTRLVAAMVLLIAAWLLLHLLIGIAIAIAGILAIVVVIAAAIWAARLLL